MSRTSEPSTGIRHGDARAGKERTRSRDTDPRSSERGSALVIAMLVTVILALLGISYLLIAQTENQMARNEKRTAQALYVAEAGLRMVTEWFNTPRTALEFPTPSVVDRTLRKVIDEADPYNPATVVDADGIIGSVPFYKQGVDLDGDGVDDLFDRPYDGNLTHKLMGTEDGPDMRIDDEDPDAAAFLETLSEKMLGDFPHEPGGVHARISRIDFYAGPYTRVGANWLRYGTGTVRVTARIYQDLGGSRATLGEKTVEAVLSEAPYRAPHAPLHSCGDTTFVPQSGSKISVHWGAIASVGSTRLTRLPPPPVDFTTLPMSLPREVPFEPGADQLWPTDPATFATFIAGLDGTGIEDPWFRVVSRGAIYGAGSGTQPFPHPPLASPSQDRSNLIQGLDLVVCPVYDYRIWKGIAQSGARNVHYYAYAGGSTYVEDGTGTPRTFQQITDGAEGLFFFDTRDGLAPTDADADGAWDNLVDDAQLRVSGSWDFRGFIYLNAESFKVDGATGPLRTVRPPAEPFLDEDLDGQFDAGERFVNLDYPTTAADLGNPIVADTSASAPVRDDRGPEIADVAVSFEGILFNSGHFEATGSGTFYGSVVALEGVTQAPSDGSAVTPTLIWDDAIAGDHWPPEGWDLPRVVVTEWDTGG